MINTGLIPPFKKRKLSRSCREFHYETPSNPRYSIDKFIQSPLQIEHLSLLGGALRFEGKILNNKRIAIRMLLSELSQNKSRLLIRKMKEDGFIWISGNFLKSHEIGDYYNFGRPMLYMDNKPICEPRWQNRWNQLKQKRGI